MHEQPQQLTEAQRAEAFVRSVMPTEQAEEVLTTLTREQVFLVKRTVEKGREEERRWELARKEGRLGEMVAQHNARVEALRVASGVLLPDQTEDIKNLLDDADDERQAWERARREGRTQEMVEAYNKALSSSELSGKDKKRAWFSSLWQK